MTHCHRRIGRGRLPSPPRIGHGPFAGRVAAAAVCVLLAVTGCATERKPAAPGTGEPTASAGAQPSEAASPSPSPSPTPSAAATATPSGMPGMEGMASASPSAAGVNACPADGCVVRFAGVTKADSGELVLDLDANYAPAVSGNHFHVYWDYFSAKQVSDDAVPRFGVTMGDWEPTADDPYTTTGFTSVQKRQSSTHICVTAGDRDHKVINPDLYECRDVSSLL